MKLVKTANGKTTSMKMSRAEWTKIGKQAGWGDKYDLGGPTNVPEEHIWEWDPVCEKCKSTNVVDSDGKGNKACKDCEHKFYEEPFTNPATPNPNPVTCDCKYCR